MATPPNDRVPVTRPTARQRERETACRHEFVIVEWRPLRVECIHCGKPEKSDARAIRASAKERVK